jgi:hypothetical protein
LTRVALPTFTAAATTIISSTGPVVGIALDANNVYWAIDSGAGAVMKAPLAGGTPVALVPAQASSYGIAVDANYVYWTLSTAAGSVMKAPLAGGGPVVTLASGQATPTNLVVDSTYVYWTNAGDYTIKKIHK